MSGSRTTLLLDPRAWLAAGALLLTLGAGLVFAAPGNREGLPRGEVVVADTRGQTLVAIDIESATVTARVPLPGFPHELLALPDGRVVASLERAGLLVLVDLDTATMETLTLGGTPHGLALESPGVLAVTDRTGGRVRRFRTSDWVELTPLAAGMSPHAVAAIGGGRLAVADAGASTLRLPGAVLATSQLPETVAAAPSAPRPRLAVAGAVGGAIEVFDLDGGLLDRYEVGGRPVRLALDGGGQRLAASLSAGGVVALIEDAAVRTLATGGTPDGLAFGDGGRLLAVGDLLSGVVQLWDVEDGDLLWSADAGASAGAVLLHLR